MRLELGAQHQRTLLCTRAPDAAVGIGKLVRATAGLGGCRVGLARGIRCAHLKRRRRPLKPSLGDLKLGVNKRAFSWRRAAATDEHDGQREGLCDARSTCVCFDFCAPTRHGVHHHAMPLVQHARHEIHFKLVYYGPGLGGKTTNLEFIHKHSRPDRRGKLISLAAESERTLFFDLLPIELGQFRGYDVRLHLCTVPGQIAQEHTRRLVLRNVDGIAFIVDSQAARIDDNLQSIIDLYDNLRLQGDDPDKLPLVVQYNKRDLPDVLPISTLRSSLRVPKGVAEFEAVATQGTGVFDTMKSLLRQCLHLVGDPGHAKEGRSPSVLAGKRESMFPTSPVPRRVSAALRAPKAPSWDVDVTVDDHDE